MNIHTKTNSVHGNEQNSHHNNIFKNNYYSVHYIYSKNIKAKHRL